MEYVIHDVFAKLDACFLGWNILTQGVLQDIDDILNIHVTWMD